MSEQIKIYPHKSKMIKSLIGSGLFVLAAGSVIYYQSSLQGFRTLFVYLAYGLVPLFLWLFLHTWFRMSFPKPLVILDPEGIIDQSSAFSAGFIPWQEIKKIFPLTVGKQHFLSVELNEPQLYLSKSKGLKQLMIKMNMQVGHAPIKIAGSMMSITMEELEIKIKNYMIKFT